MRTRWATVITDASHCPQTRVAGWAAWVRITDLPAPIKQYGSLRRRVSNSTEAEMYAALNGLWLAHRHGAEAFYLQCDNTGVLAAIEQGAGIYANRWWQEIEGLGLSSAPLRTAHIKGHTRGETPRLWVHNWCDTQAGKAMREARAR